MPEENIFEVTKTLELMIKRVKKIGTNSDISRVQSWLTILRGHPSKNDLNDLWNEIQHNGSHMGYMDYVDDEFKKINGKLISLMLDLIVDIRSIKS